MRDIYVVVFSGRGQIYHPNCLENGTFYTSREVAQSVCDDLNETGFIRKIINALAYAQWSVRKLTNPYARN